MAKYTSHIPTHRVILLATPYGDTMSNKRNSPEQPPVRYHPIQHITCGALLSLVLLVASGCNLGSTGHVSSGWTAPVHPFMVANEHSNIHNDAYMTDSYSIAGPTDGNPTMTTKPMNRLCVTIAFDSRGAIKTLCTGADGGRAVYLLDPVTLATNASYELPSSTNIGAAGAGYFYIDNLDRIVVPTVNKHIFRLEATGNPPVFRVETDFDLTSLPDPGHIESALPDWTGRLWFVTEEGVVGTVEKGTPPKTISLAQTDGAVTVSEGIFNSFAMDETGGIYVVSDHALYRLDADANGNPAVTWREEYDRGTRRKPGQFSQGSGTTPTLIGRDYLAITDNSEPRMNVLVYRRQRNVAGSRLVCRVPVFAEGASATENSLIAFSNSIIVENNYGYTRAVHFIGKLSAPGVVRINFSPDGHCENVWEADIIVPSVVSKYSAESGMVYTYAKDRAGWYFTGLSGATGKAVFAKKVGGGRIEVQ